MSGRLPFRVNQVLTGMQNPDWDMPSEMTAIPKKLKMPNLGRNLHESFLLVLALGLNVLIAPITSSA